MKHEIRIFFTALMFFTRIPCPAWVDHSEEYLNQSSRYFPVMGWIVGSFGAAVFISASLVLPLTLAVLLSMIATVLLTGAFHEDGFADMCDGFGGGWTKIRILEIMQDSRLGTFGAIGLGFVLTVKFLCLYVLAERNPTLFVAFALFAGHSASRLTAVTFLRTHEYARVEGESKTKPLATQLTNGSLVFALLTGLAPLLVFSWKGLALILPLVLVKWYLGRFFTRWIGGYTGDCLGATQQVAEVALYLALVLQTPYHFL